MRKYLYILTVLSIIMLMSSCSSDLHYANSFLRKFERNKASASEKIFVLLPQTVIHTNSSLNEVPGFSLMSETEQDSVIASLTKILDKLDDSIFIDQFNKSFLFTLSRSRIPIVVVNDRNQMPAADDQHFTVEIVQLEAEEYVRHRRSDFRTRKGMYYAYDYDLSHFSTNVWLRLDARDTNDQIYFKNVETSEHFRGTVTSINEGKATMKTNFERIDVNDAYRVARRLGSICATLYVEKILTEYVCRTKGTARAYFYYNPQYNGIDEVVPYDEGIKESFEKL